MGNTGCVIVDGYCIHCRRPDHLQASDDYKCPGSATIPVAQSAIERWVQEPAVQDVLSIMDCGPWESGRWDDTCEKCKRASAGLAGILDERDRMKEGLDRALKLLGRAECENCGMPLVEMPRMGDCPDFPHVDTATKIAALKKLLSSK